MGKRIIFAVTTVAMAAVMVAWWPGHAPLQASTNGPPLRKIASFDLPGPPGKRFDYLTIDYDDGYLLAAHLGAGLLYVIDLKTNQVVRTIPDLAGIEGVEYVPELKKVYTSDWFEKKIGVVDLRQGKIIAKLPGQLKPDGSTYAAPFRDCLCTDQLQRPA